MAKRFTESEKWRDSWFMDLSPEFKLLWLFLIDQCDCAGIWDINKKLTETIIGTKIDWELAKQVLNGRVIELPSNKWFIPKFLLFQYPEGLTDSCKATLGVLRRLSLHKLFPVVKRLYGNSYIRVTKGLVNSILTVQDKDKDKEKEKEKNVYSELFEELWSLYPRKDTKKDALRHFNSSVTTEEAAKKIRVALTNYLSYVETDVREPRYIKNGKTWFNNWEDWVDYKPRGKVEGAWGR